MTVFINTKKGMTLDQVYTTLARLNTSHYVNPRGVSITNTISLAELAATAAPIIHGYSHTATDSLSSMHKLESSSHN